MAERITVTSPVGRIVAGSLYKPNDKNYDGKPLTTKDGKPRVQYFIALAIPKTPGLTHWGFEEWGKHIWTVGHQAFPQAAQRPDFAWKIEDGDSQFLNKRNRKPCEQVGYPGNWIVKFSGGFALKIFRQEGAGWVQMLEPDAVKPGFFVQVAFTVDGNEQTGNPGVYLNPQAVCFRAFGPEIQFGPNVDEMGFGAAPLPPGASLQPSPASAPPPGGSTYTPQAPAAPGAPQPVPVVPQPQFLQVPANGGYPLPPNPSQSGPSGGIIPVPAAPAPPTPNAMPASPSNQFRMTPKAGVLTREAYIAAGWTDAQLVAEGLMTL